MNRQASTLRPGPARRRQLTGVLWALAGFGLIAAIALAVLGEDRPLVVIETRTLDRTSPPWTYVNDQRRFLRLVVQPLCPGSPGSPVSFELGPAVAESCKLGPEGRIEVKLRADYPPLPGGGQPTPADVRRGLLRVPETSGLRVTVSGDGLQIAWEEGRWTPELALQHLQWTPAPLLPLGAQAVEPLGTGPYVVKEVWCKDRSHDLVAESVGAEGLRGAAGGELDTEETSTGARHPTRDAAPGGKGSASSEDNGSPRPGRLCTRVGGRPPDEVRELGFDVEDVVVLEARGSVGDGPKRVVFAGVSLGAKNSGSGSSSADLYAAIAEALDRGDAHAVFDIESRDLGAARSLSRSAAPWELRERRGSQVLVAAVVPVREVASQDGPHSESRMREPCRGRVLTALRGLASDAAFLREIDADPTAQILPGRFGAWYFQPQTTTSTSADPPEPDYECRAELLTNTNWTDVALNVKQYVETADASIVVEVKALSSQDEARRRDAGKYDISMLAVVYQPQSPAHFLWDNLVGAHWVGSQDKNALFEMAREEAAALATDSAHSAPVAGAIPGKVRQETMWRVGDSVVAIANARSRFAVHSDLGGLSEDSRILDPERIALKAPTRRGVIFGLLGVVLVLVVVALWSAVRAGRAGRALEPLQRAVRVFRHELLAPLNTIRALGRSGCAPDAETVEAIAAEADIAREIVERTQWVVKAGRVTTDQEPLTQNLVGDVISPAAEAARRRSRYLGFGEAQIDVELHDPIPPVAIPLLHARLVLDNLMTNALRYRGATPASIAISAKVVGRAVAVSVSDNGMGIRHEDSKRLFERDFRGSDAVDVDAQGLGLGLFLCREVVEEAGGTIRLERLASPTTFVVAFPVAPQVKEEPRR